MKRLLWLICIILNIFNKIFLIVGILIGMIFAILGTISLFIFFIGLFIKIPNNNKFIYISLICFSIKIITIFIYSIIQIYIIDRLYNYSKTKKISY